MKKLLLWIIVSILLLSAFVSYGVLRFANSTSNSLTFFEGFNDDFDAGRTVPNLVDASLSSQFSAINAPRPACSGKLTIRDRDVLWQPGDPVFPSARLDFSDGQGTFVTFRFDAGLGYTITGGTVSFDVVAYGSDGGHLYKYVSADGATFIQVGDDSAVQDAHYAFAVATGGSSTFFRLKVGTSAGIYEGVHVDNIKADVTVSPSPPPHTTYTLTITTLLRGTSNPSSGTHQYSPGTIVSVSATPNLGYYFFYYWMLDGVIVGSANPISVTMDTNHTLEAVFLNRLLGGVGGIFVPVDKFSLLAPYIGLASTILVATTATGVYVKRAKRRKEKQ
jgi:hypothetical protein